MPISKQKNLFYALKIKLVFSKCIFVLQEEYIWIETCPKIQLQGWDSGIHYKNIVAQLGTLSITLPFMQIAQIVNQSYGGSPCNHKNPFGRSG